MVPMANGVTGRFMVFRGGPAARDQVAVVVGDPDPAKPVLVRAHSACLTGDLFGSLRCDCGDQLDNALARLAEEGGGVLLYLDQEGRGIGIGNKMRAYALQDDGFDTIDADAVLGFSADERRYEYAASILHKLGYRKVILLTNNPEKIGGLTRAGIEVVGRQPLFGAVTAQNNGYLRTKEKRAQHMLQDLLRATAGE
jgi:GTP cyclohydrolase II